MRHVVIALLALALPGCGSTPKPFEHDTAEDQSYARQEKNDVAIVPPEYMPGELGERVARLAVEKLALLAAAAALNPVSPRHAELFAATRLAGNHASMYGAVDLAPGDVSALLERALP